MALLAENGQILLDSKLPEEFLVPVPMRLSAQELEVLHLEFPEWMPITVDRQAEAEAVAATVAEAGKARSKK